MNVMRLAATVEGDIGGNPAGVVIVPRKSGRM